MTETILEQGITDVTSDREDNGDGDQYIETAKVEAADRELFSEPYVVEKREWEPCRNAVVREHVPKHTNLLVDRCRAPYKCPELLGDESLVPPFLERIEDEFTAAECVLLPTVQLVRAGLRKHDEHYQQYVKENYILTNETPSLKPPPEYEAQRMM